MKSIKITFECIAFSHLLCALSAIIRSLQIEMGDTEFAKKAIQRQWTPARSSNGF